jgi:hypothetical protein
MNGIIEFTNLTATEIIFPLRFYGDMFEYKIPANGKRIISVDALTKHKEACKYYKEQVKNSFYIRFIKEGWLQAKRIS